MSYKSNLKNIKAFVFDVDGVFTDGSVYLMPDKNMCRVMNVLDGYAVVKAIKENYKICVITGGDDPMVRNRINYLGITDYYAKISNKLEKFEEFKQKYNLANEEILTMGDDLPDISMMKISGISACPQNSVAEVKALSDYISPIQGGKGAVRDVIEQVMKVQGKWILDDTKST
ncbi:KdsC family phosphatase [Chryseobacterium koreense]|uniref:3-deoxy-D-manno-octulosonate 8-phosphate phosphatase n=1 Tax=Chryseobacterium koreense CCUG 49689 TaxID=1304281 RepID=A0A0J7IZZ2_9FLAO|nr:HAD hydrolase family protein [Chryseobacterium koreense]KMQ71396.1 3-deoxy-D-manno-octulosonate 8-phosphate phosphatase [Chryseobacterium koreense CCUG 49689]MBB5332234.1 3-deoxy-D-manno-octulosonate 8-phosphate phosphatase (KDO 8-P phosphatase) [Chryseobacterium koreense]